jgi:hypothetical protein
MTGREQRVMTGYQAIAGQQRPDEEGGLSNRALAGVQAGLPIKNPHKKPKKTTKNVFFGFFFNFLFFMKIIQTFLFETDFL